MAIYVVSHSGPDYYEPNYLEGPEVVDWEEYCQSLMDEIVNKALELCSKGNIGAYKYVNKWNKPIKEDDLCEATIKVLETKGYKKIQLPNSDFNWQGKWRENTILIAHNMQAMLECDEERLIEVEKQKADGDSEYMGDDHLEYFQKRVSEARNELNEFLEAHPEISKK